MSAKTSVPAPIPSSLTGGNILSPSYALPPNGSSSFPQQQQQQTQQPSSSSSTSTLVTQHARDTSLPPSRQVDAAVFEYLTIEMTRTLQESALVAARKILRHRDELREAGFTLPASLINAAGAASNGDGIPGAEGTDSPNSQQQGKYHRSVSQAVPVSSAAGAAGAVAESVSRRFSTLSIGAAPSEEEVDLELHARLESIGYHVGANIAEKLSSLRPPHGSVLDVLKFVCKDVWTAIWEKQVDNLRTNHRGVYVLQDNHFKPLRRMSTAHGPQETAKQAKPHLSFCSGIVRGALARLGVATTVTVDILLPPTSSSASSTSASASASAQQPASGASSGAQSAQGSSAPVPPLAHVTACTFSVRIASGR